MDVVNAGSLSCFKGFLKASVHILSQRARRKGLNALHFQRDRSNDAQKVRAVQEIRAYTVMAY